METDLVRNALSVSTDKQTNFLNVYRVQATVNKIDDWAKKWRIKINQSKSTHITFTLRNQTCPTVQMGSVDLPQKNEVKYLGMHLYRRLTWERTAKPKENSSTQN
jgi:aspartate carbamoyltransferase regulatory subunit